MDLFYRMGENLPMDFTMDPSWSSVLSAEFEKPYFKELQEYLSKEQDQDKTIYPSQEKIFEAFRLTPLTKVKVVILGQDPYHGPGQAHGLSFSVPEEVKIPPSLANIFQELHTDLNVPVPKNGNLEAWAQRGVLLLNTVLTVEAHKAHSHRKRGWETFTDKVIGILNGREHLVFMLWGTPAQKKASFVDGSRHLVLTSVHPSPLSVYRGFYGSRPFSQANSYLKDHGRDPIDWSL